MNAPKIRTSIQSVWRSVFRLPIPGLVGVVFVVFWVVIAILGPSIAPYEVGAIVAPDVFGSLTSQNPLGTDYLGRDMLSRILFGARYTVGLALAAALAASITGTALGLTAAVAGRWIDELMSRVMDALISIPSKMLALVIVASFGSSVQLLMLTAWLSYTPGAYRIARSLAVNVKTLEYVQVARARGEKLPYIACVEILPNMINPMLADFGLRFVFVVLLLSGMSFLGLGVQPPNADLGSLVRENISGLGEGAPAVIMPALAIATLTVSVNMLIDSLSGRSVRAEN